MLVLNFTSIVTSELPVLLLSLTEQSCEVVYNCFFVESRQAKQHQRDIIFRGILKIRTWITAESFSE